MSLGFGFKGVGQALDVFITRITNEVNQEINSPLEEYLCSIFFYGTSTRKYHTSIGFKNLPKGRYGFKFEPTASLSTDHIDAEGNLLVSASQRGGRTFDIYSTRFDKGDSNNVAYGLGYTIEGREIIIEGSLRKAGNISAYDRNHLGIKLQTYEWKDLEYSYENTLPFNLTSVNEIVESGEQVRYQELSLLEVKLKASERLTSPPRLSVLIRNGQTIPYYLSWGVVENITGGQIVINHLSDTVFPYYDTESTDIVNLSTTLQYKGNYTSLTEFNVGDTSSFSVGDEICTFKYAPTSFLPDVFCDLLLDEEYGNGSVINRRMIDFKSIIQSKVFCRNNNLYWDNVISEAQDFASWISGQAISSLLIPLRINGKYGLIPESPDLPVVAVFNESNIIKSSYSLNSVSESETKLNKVLLLYKDGNDERRQTRTVEVISKGAYDGGEPIKEVKKTFEAITNVEQAIDVAIATLNSAKLQKEQISFKTDYGGLDLSPGDIISVQQAINNFDYNATGIILESIDNGTYTEIATDKETPLEKDWTNYKAYVKIYDTGEVREYSISEASEGKLFLSPNTAPLPAEGDPIILFKPEITNKKFRIQAVDIGEDGVSIEALNWTRDILKFTSLDNFSGYSEDFLPKSGYIRRSTPEDSYYIYRE